MPVFADKDGTPECQSTVSLKMENCDNCHFTEIIELDVELELPMVTLVPGMDAGQQVEAPGATPLHLQPALCRGACHPISL